MDVLAPFRHLRNRPVLLSAGAVGVAAGIAASRAMADISAVLIGWCVGVAVYLALATLEATRSTPQRIRARSEQLDEGGLAILLVTAGAAVASLVAIVLELANAKGAARNGGEAALAAATVILSWLFLHTMFAFHYAHEYYNDAECAGGLNFPDTKEPNYWDFAYFSFIVGMTAQVADVATAAPAMRKLVLAHSIVSFFFNTAILALGVNLAASFLG